LDILQRATEINSAGGYLRGLTRKAEAGEFSLGPVLMALINGRRGEKKSA
jgi:replication initiation protein RepC